ncbi:ketimine reductase mu-crystallin [Condylostylus longicornis]|uniref:ketimine reductase mu-crystallin n=1 Tax=Condylostylus longicornis TaxID=2530218 RepID=UPI00244DAA42|nr:ketimine reductase mu-crystallin [Condylostylus longicornis]
MSVPVIISDEQVKKIITWPIVNEAVEEAFKAICCSADFAWLRKHNKESSADQPARTRTNINNINNHGLLFTMPGFVSNYTLNSKKYSTLGCKMVTMFKENEKRNPPLPSILANIALFNSETGQLECIIDGTEITAWRTAAASVIATKYLYFKRKNYIKEPIVAIIGCGVQGKSHSLGLCHTFPIKSIQLWNRTTEKAFSLLNCLESEKENFINKNINITVFSSIDDCVRNADIIVTSTYVDEPIIHFNMLKKDVHINAVGCGPTSHHVELSQKIYDKSILYIDHWAGASVELKDLKCNIVCEVGEAIIDQTKIPEEGISIFQSLGMAVEDVTTAQALYEAFKKQCE